MRSIAVRLFLAFVCVIFFLVIQVVFAFYNASYIFGIQEDAFEKRLAMKSFERRIGCARIHVFEFLSTTNPAEMDRYRKEYQKDMNQLVTGMERSGIPSELLDSSRKTYEKIINNHYHFYFETARELINNDSRAEYVKFSESLKKMAEDVEEQARLKVKKAARNAQFITYGICFFAVFTALAWAFNLIGSVTDRRKAEEKMASLRKYMKNIIDSMPSVLVGVDTGGRVTQWNKAAEKATGMTPDEAEGKLFVDVFPGLAREIEKVRTAIHLRTAQKDSKVATNENGVVRFADITVYPLIANGVDGAVIRVDDVTDRVRIEEMMVQSEKMASVGGLAAGMAHEINNPLAGIMQNAQVVQKRISEDLPANRRAAKESGVSLDAVRQYMELRGISGMIAAISESGRRAAKIVENMLSFSRKSAFDFKAYDIPALLDRTIELAANDYDLKKKFDFRRIEIVRQYENSLPEVVCEGSKIQQVFLNILKNGSQAMAENRQPKAPACFTLRVLAEEEMVRVEIDDNGPGMTDDVRKRIFEPFFTTKDVGKGTGLGLSVSYFIVTENHGGTMAVESVRGVGTKFIVRLPVKRR